MTKKKATARRHKRFIVGFQQSKPQASIMAKALKVAPAKRADELRRLAEAVSKRYRGVAKRQVAQLVARELED